MQNEQYDPRLAGWVRALTLARAWTEPSWKVLIVVGFVAAPLVHFLTNSMPWLIGIAALGFLPLVVCIATDMIAGMKIAALTSRDEFHQLQQVVDRGVASPGSGSEPGSAAEPVVRLPAVTPMPRMQGSQDPPQETVRR